ncbi:MAG: hypothetical protein A2270_06765 [Elusimicrobia bacterium RIFOXYA12_FULL_51_18]|nr:MAG: hypothetical protein A2270_06765 [Elusimicrobia bacterium RIFOXYA12_FULL_51_18]OGS30628.1 MAG: hypothetical protein A2218_06080 [Elusimicrobia bacterium RIFOXYA2_FULL_53_38]
MFLTKRSSNWTNIGYVKKSWKTLGGIIPERLVILDAVWKKEIGRIAEHCELLGVNKGYIVVKTESSVVYNEIFMNSRQILKSLNKYFAKPWLKGIKHE